MNCPFCDAEKYNDPDIAYGKYKCGTLENAQLPRYPGCWQRWALNQQAELTQLRLALAECQAKERDVEITCLTCGHKASYTQEEEQALACVCPICKLRKELAECQTQLVHRMQRNDVLTDKIIQAEQELEICQDREDTLLEVVKAAKRLKDIPRLIVNMDEVRGVLSPALAKLDGVREGK